MTAPHRLALAALLGLAGCGGLETPDLAHGAVEVRVVGASADGFAYPLGQPGLSRRVAADGSVRFDGLPVGPLRLLVYDDTLVDGTRRAELVGAVVTGAGVVRLVRNGENAPVAPADKMAWAGRVVASVSPDGGGLAVAPRFAVVGTALAAIASPGSPAAELGLLPAAAGVYQLTAAEDGYKPATLDIDVASATNGYDVPLEIETSGDGPRGCEASGGACVNGLHCEAETGRCVQCLADGDCPAGASCDLGEHFCSAPPPGGPGYGAVCSSCTVDTQCDGGTLAAGRCELAAGSATGFCTWAPPAGYGSSCPAGFIFVADDAGIDRCLPAVTCQAYFAKFGQGCFSDDGCQAGGAVAGSTCYGADPDVDVPGYCTAECRTAPDTCVVPGFHCEPGLLRCLRN